MATRKHSSAQNEGTVPVTREECIDTLRSHFSLYMDVVLEIATERRGWRLSEPDYQKLVELKAQGEAIIANARPVFTKATVLRLVRA